MQQSLMNIVSLENWSFMLSLKSNSIKDTYSTSAYIQVKNV